MNPGKAITLNKHLSILEATSAQDSMGQVTKTWTEIAKRWASITPLSGRELEYAQMIHSETTHKIVMRYTSIITTHHRLQLGARVFAILSILNPEEKGITLDIQAREVD